MENKHMMAFEFIRGLVAILIAIAVAFIFIFIFYRNFRVCFLYYLLHGSSYF